MTKMVINPNRKLSRINREIYGHFSEHLGRCIYEGIYVGENSPIENVNGMRTDVVEALKEIRVPVLRWPGGCFSRRSWFGWHVGFGFFKHGQDLVFGSRLEGGGNKITDTEGLLFQHIPQTRKTTVL